jgi:hypothetical protein
MDEDVIYTALEFQECVKSVGFKDLVYSYPYALEFKTLEHAVIYGYILALHEPCNSIRKSIIVNAYTLN